MKKAYVVWLTLFSLLLAFLFTAYLLWVNRYIDHGYFYQSYDFQNWTKSEWRMDNSWQNHILSKSLARLPFGMSSLKDYMRTKELFPSSSIEEKNVPLHSVMHEIIRLYGAKINSCSVHQIENISDNCNSLMAEWSGYALPRYCRVKYKVEVCGESNEIKELRYTIFINDKHNIVYASTANGIKNKKDITDDFKNFNWELSQ